MLEDEYMFLINHIFLPRKLPNKIDEKYDSNEGILLKITKNTLKTLNKIIENTCLNKAFFSEIIRMFTVWEQIQSSVYLNSKLIRKKIKSLKINQSFPLYLRCQNSCILIDVLSNEQNFPIVLSTFRPSLSNEEVLSTTGDIYGKFPSASFYISKKTSIKSKAFAELIEDLGNNNIGNPESEIRNVSNDNFVSEWLSIFLSDDVPLSKYPKKVTKKVVDEILWKKSILPFRRSGNLNLILKI